MTAGYETRTKQETTSHWSTPCLNQVQYLSQQLNLARGLPERTLSYAPVARIGC